jgi:hypothetical protein
MPTHYRKQKTVTILLFTIAVAACLPAKGFSALFTETTVGVTGYIEHTGGNTKNTYAGLSGYPTSTTEIDKIIDAMEAKGLNIYRMSANPEWFTGKPHPYRANFVQYFLDHSNFTIIVDRNHIYPPDESGATAFRANIATAKASVLEVCAAWPNNPRIIVELGNEYVSSDFHTVFQDMINDVRAAGYKNSLLIDKWNTAWNTCVFTDSQSNIYTGYHYYFNSWSLANAESQMQSALSLGLRIINTEIGADYNEASAFDLTEIAELNQFLAWCAARGIGNTVWMNENLSNWQRYQELGLTFLPPA